MDGLRADLVTARAAVAHAAWHGRRVVETEDVRAAARLALPHRARRDPFDPPGLDEQRLEEALEAGAPQGPDDDPDHDPDHDPDDDPSGGPVAGTPAQTPTPTPPHRTGPPMMSRRNTAPHRNGVAARSDDEAAPAPAVSQAEAGEPYRARLLTVSGSGVGRGRGVAVARSRAPDGRSARVDRTPARAADRTCSRRSTTAAPHQLARGRSGPGLIVHRSDLRLPVREGREGNLVLLAVDASGSMAARSRLREVKTAVLSLLLDAYQRRDKVGLITFRGAQAEPRPAADVQRRGGGGAVAAPGGRRPHAAGRGTGLGPPTWCASSSSRTPPAVRCWWWSPTVGPPLARTPSVGPEPPRG